MLRPTRAFAIVMDVTAGPRSRDLLESDDRRKWFGRQEGANAPAYLGWYGSALDRRLELRIAAEEIVDLLPAVVIRICHSITLRICIIENDEVGQ